MEMQFIEPYLRCPICDCDRLRPSFSLAKDGAILNWDICLNCALTFQNPRLAPTTIQWIYSSDEYWGGADPKSKSAYHNYEKNDPVRIRQSQARLAKILTLSSVKQGTLLDVGCATGFFGSVAKANGFDVTGIEPSERMANFGRTEYGLTIHQNILEEVALPRDYFDIITLWGTDSHFLHPREGFAQLIRSLKPGGIFSMNYQLFTHWIRKIFPGIKKNWNALFLFSEKSLRILFQHLDLEILYHKTEWQCTTVDHLSRILKLWTPRLFGPLSLKLPAISFPLVIARKRARSLLEVAA